MWFAGGPGVKQSLLAVPDPSQPFGNPNCTECAQCTSVKIFIIKDF